ncbi:hypothetical protein Lal_00031414 [Lupinus albus]|nr:hypothetical protein Lal_00031414 [Lupinus albus]
MIGNNTSDFNSLIKVGDRIEQSIKAGKIAAEQTVESKKPNYAKKKEAEAHYVSGESHKPPNKNNHNLRPYTPRPHYNQTQYQPNQQTPYQPIAYINHNRPPTQHNPTPHYNQPRPNQYPAQQNKPPNNYQTRPYQNFNRNQPRPFQPQRTFDPIPVTYAELFAHPQTERILAPIAGQTPNTTAPWYDPNANCNYHFGIIGHSTETCRALKHRIQDLIDSKWLEFKDTVPTITGNPLPNHENQGINVLEQDDDMAVVEKVEDMKTPLKVIFKVLCQQGLVEMVEGVHMKMMLLDSRLLVIEKKVKGSDIFVLERDQKIQDRIITRKFVPVLNIPAGTPSYTAPPRWVPRLYIESGATRHPGPFPYKSDKAVPWKYQGKSVAKSKQMEEVVNLAGVGNMTRSGRVYSPVNLSKKIINASKGKEKIVETSEDRPEPEYGQGMENTLVLPSNSGRAGLGYSPSNYREGASEDKKGEVAQLGTFMYKGRKVPIPHISQSFISTCFIKPDTIAMVEDGQLESDLGPVYQCIPGTGLSNWTEEDVASDVYYAILQPTKNKST